MAFNVAEVARLFPSYLSKPDKDRIVEGLSQFGEAIASTPKLYTDFYAPVGPAYLLQGDLLPSVRLPVWQPETAAFAKSYANALLIANTCDVDVVGNPRNVPKEIGFVQLVPLADYLQSLTDKLTAQQVPAATISSRVAGVAKDCRNQVLTNVFYLPAGPGDLPEQLALLDRPFWFPAAELVQVGEALRTRRLASLSQWGYYLFILKLSYHLCRLPEELDRR